MASSVSRDRLLESKPQLALSQFREKELQGGKSPCLMTSSVPSLETLPYPGELSESCDVTCVLETPTALKTYSFSTCKTPRL